jgi:AcrR family transcriptional regulator
MTPSQDSEQKILAAARAILAQQGYTATTVSQVAADAGVSRGLLHYYFKNKEDMLAHVIQAAAEDSLNLINAAFAHGKTAGDLAAALAGALRNIEIVAPDLFTLFFEGWAVSRQSPVVAEELRTLFRRFRESLQAALEDAAARGSIAPTLPADGLAALLIGILDGLALQRITDRNGDPPVIGRPLARRRAAALFLDDIGWTSSQ